MAPKLVSSTVLNTTTHAGMTSTFYDLTFDCSTNAPSRLGSTVDAKASADVHVTFDIEVMTPTLPPKSAPPPLFLTQTNHRQWALAGVRRGYAALVYPACDTADAAPDFQHAYRGEATMMLIVARAFVASRALDFAMSAVGVSAIGFNTSQVAIAGHSRNGKQSLLAAAFDERFTAVGGSSSGAPISAPFHFNGPEFYGEGPVTGGVAGKWWLESIKQYGGRENMLPMDGHGVLGMIAPRACALANAWFDEAGMFALLWLVLFVSGLSCTC